MEKKQKLPGIKGDSSDADAPRGPGYTSGAKLPTPPGATTGPQAATPDSSVGSGIAGSAYGSETSHTAGIPGMANDRGIHGIEGKGGGKFNPAHPRTHNTRTLEPEEGEKGALPDVGTADFD